MHSLKRLSVSLDKLFPKRFQRFLTSEPAVVAKSETKEKCILVDRVESVTTIGINRPERKNSLDVATAQQLSEALDEFERDDTSNAAVLYGTRGNFCAGYDLQEIANYDGEREDTVPQFGALANRNELAKKPLIAALSGYAVGVGFELALMCDMRVMEETAVLGFLNRRFGIPILSGGTVRLPAIIGYARAMEVILTGRPISADEAFKWGLVNRVVTCGSALGQAVNYARSLAKFPQSTMLADRASAHFATFSAKQMDEALQFEKDNASHLLLEEGVKGAQKFVKEGLGKHGKCQDITLRDKSIRELDSKLLQ